MGKSDSDYKAALKHQYRVEPGGETVPGVTTVQSIIEKPAFKWTSSEIAANAVLDTYDKQAEIVATHREWLKSGKPDRKKFDLAENGSDREVYVHWARGEFDRQWKAKASRGNRVHAIAEAWARGESPEVNIEDNGYVDALERFYKTYKPKFHHVECIVLNAELRYGGRFDFIAELDGPGASGYFMGDFKTTGGYYADSVAVQEIAYMKAGMPTYDDEGALQHIALPEVVEGARVVQLREDGTVGMYDPFAIVSQEDAWSMFKASLDLFNLNKRIQQQLKEGEYE